jgi:voltage-gated potassium channel
VLASAVGLYAAEKDQGGPIKTFGDALWNAWSTVGAVGESGCPPVTPAGRLIGSVLMLVGNPLYDQTKEKVGQLLGSLTGRGEG